MDDGPVMRPSADPSQTGVGFVVVEIVYKFILVLTVGTWAIIGLAVWIPLLMRVTTVLAGAVFYSTLFRDQARVLKAQQAVHFGVRFYIRGFQHFIEFYRQRNDPEPPVGLLEPLTVMKWAELLIECVWVLVVWALTYWAFRAVLTHFPNA